MASRQAPAAQAGGEVSEREYQETLNRAVADTEGEIFGDALGSDELDNDGDTSLEEMGDGLEGEVEDDEADEEAEGDGDGEEAEEGDEAESEEAEGKADAEDGGDAEAERDSRGRFRDREPAVPPGRLREQTQRATAAEERAQALERQVFEMNGRLAELSARQNAPPQRQQQTEAPPKPDMFAEPEKYEAWVIAEAERRADVRTSQRFAEFQQQQQAMSAQRVDESLATAARGERAFEFGAAYNALTSLDPRNPQARATVARIYNAPDPSQALFDWWEQNGGPEYRERVYEQVAPRVQRNGNAPRQQMRNGQDQPRHVIRPAQRLPSLNSATGSNSQRTADPEMQDGSERSVFDYGSRR